MIPLPTAEPGTLSDEYKRKGDECDVRTSTETHTTDGGVGELGMISITRVYGKLKADRPCSRAFRQTCSSWAPPPAAVAAGGPAWKPSRRCKAYTAPGAAPEAELGTWADRRAGKAVLCKERAKSYYKAQVKRCCMGLARHSCTLKEVQGRVHQSSQHSWRGRGPVCPCTSRSTSRRWSRRQSR